MVEAQITKRLTGGPEYFFLPGERGNLCTLYHPPADSAPDRGDIIYVHPFADELYNSRPVIAWHIRSLVSFGVGVLQADLFGCGSSAGDFRDARWDIWKQDLAAARAWLQTRGRNRVSLWGVRLGALLAMDFAAESPGTYERVVLWAPVIDGEESMTQFLRARVAFSGMRERSDHRETVGDLRRRLASGECLEVAGYELPPELVFAIDQRRLAPLGKAVSAPLHWVELGAGMPAAAERVNELWRGEGVSVSTYIVAGKPFWVHFRALATDYAQLGPVMRRIFGDENRC